MRAVKTGSRGLMSGAKGPARTRRRSVAAAGLVALSLTGATGGISAAVADDDPGSTVRVSVSSAEAQADDESYGAKISADGRYVAFFSRATNLVAGDENRTWDMFLRNLSTGTTQRVSVGARRVEADDTSWGSVALSRHGRYVAFESFARNLVPGDTGGLWDVFVRDRRLKTTERVSVSSTGVQGNNGSVGVAISTNGRYVAFYSRASNLVAGDTNRRHDVFVRDLAAGTTTRVSVRSNGGQANSDSAGPVVSANGRYVGFYSDASNLVAGDTNGVSDAFVRDRANGTTTRISVRSNGAQANAESYIDSISADGRFVSFSSWASNLVAGDTNGVRDVFVRDRATGTTRRVSVGSDGTEGNGESLTSAVSPDGRFVAFGSAASNLVIADTNGEPDVFVRDRATGAIRLVSVDTVGTAAGGGDPSISADGRFVSFSSWASHLVAGDTNGIIDVFVRDLWPQ
jgi:hypothetical protein